MAYDSIAAMLADQLISLAWIRCVQEEGVDFVNKQTGAVEKDEKVIYEAFENDSGIFDMPAAKGSRWGLEKNILEVYGSYLIFGENEKLDEILISVEMKSILKAKIQTLRNSK